jgi:hypothetical protein
MRILEVLTENWLAREKSDTSHQRTTNKGFRPHVLGPLGNILISQNQFIFKGKTRETGKKFQAFQRCLNLPQRQGQEASFYLFHPKVP